VCVSVCVCVCVHLRRQHHSPVEEGQELVLIVALQAVGSHGTQDGPDAADAQCSGQEAGVEQDLLVPRFQLVRHVMSVNVEVFKRECHHGQHGCAWKWNSWHVVVSGVQAGV